MLGLGLSEVEQVFEEVLALLPQWAAMLVIASVISRVAALVIIVIIIVVSVRTRGSGSGSDAELLFAPLVLALGVFAFGARQPLQFAAIQEDAATLGAAIDDHATALDSAHWGEALGALQVGGDTHGSSNNLRVTGDG
jgi:hypothetical protein